jgi:alpha-ketoglutarate-dependent taurine dioxygenase
MCNRAFNAPQVQTLGDDVPLRLRANVCLEEDVVQDLINHIPFGSDEPHSSRSASSFIRTRIPELWQLACSVYISLQHGVPALVIENLPFSGFDLDVTKHALLAFASCIGEPIGADHYRRDLVWPVSPRHEMPPTYTPTITEHYGSAEFHTDSAFKVVPENYVLLFAHQPAADGGGLSLLLSASSVLAKLSETNCGRECMRILQSNSFPFRVPTAFTRHRRDTDVEWINAPILSDHPQIRYRYDLIASALECLHIPLSSEAEWALAYFKQALHQLSPCVLGLNRGDLLVLNNHSLMHGRTAFEDRNRMLLRVRLANTHPLILRRSLHDNSTQLDSLQRYRPGIRTSR